MGNPVVIYRHNAKEPDRYYYDTNLHNNSGWSDGIAAFHAYPPSDPQPGAIPIYRHRSIEKPDRYYYDTNPTNNSGWSDGTVAFYAYGPSEDPQPGTIPIYQHRSFEKPDRYYYDTNPTNNSGWSDGTVWFRAYPPGWMARVDNNALLSQMSLPGTHESMSRFGYGSVCHRWTLDEQLANGVRVFDIRVRYLPGDDGRVNFSIHHADDYQHAFFDSKFPYTSDSKYFVLDECLAFLKENPTECIVLLIKQEKDVQVRNTFFDAFWRIIDNRNGYDGKSLDELFYTGNTVPRLKDARGKIIFVFVDGDEGGNYRLSSPRWGLYWGNIDYRVDWKNPEPGQQPGLDVENHWKDFKDAKWDRVKAHLESSLATGPAATIWWSTFSSASRVPELDYFPEDYANYLLPKVQEFLEQSSGAPPNRPWGAYFGTVMMDFPTTDVISLLIRAAQQYLYPT